MTRRTNSWKIEVEDYTKLDNELLNSILEDGEKYFDGMIEDSNSLTTRAYNWLTLVIGGIAGLLSFIIAKADANVALSKPLMFLIIILIAIGSYVIVQLVKVVFPSLKMVKGNTPKPINFKSIEISEKEIQHKLWLLDSIENIQHKIEYNEEKILNRINKFSNVISLLAATFIISSILLLIIISI